MNKSPSILDSLDWDIEPSRDLWPEIEAKLSEHTVSTAPIYQTQSKWMPMAMAACLMLTVGSMSFSFYALNQNNQQVQMQTALLLQQQEAIRSIELQHEEVKSQLVGLLQNPGDTLSPTLVADANDILNTTELAAKQLKRAIAEDPSQSLYLKKLARTYRQEAELLKRIKTSQELAI